MTTDELIETLGQRQTKAMAFEREHGLEGLVTLSIDEASALISALKENKRLREALNGMLKHSCVADADPTDKDEEDHAFERAARAALQPQLESARRDALEEAAQLVNSRRSGGEQDLRSIVHAIRALQTRGATP